MPCYRCRSPEGTEVQLCPTCREQRKAGRSIATARELIAQQEEPELERRPLFERMLCCLLWVIPIAILGMLVTGAMLALSVQAFGVVNDIQAVLKRSAVLVLPVSAGLTVVLAMLGVLPGTSPVRVRRPRNPSSIVDSDAPWYIKLFCLWPLVLVAFGGAVGGGLGGAASALSFQVYRKTRSTLLTLVASVLLGTGAVLAWALIAQHLRSRM